MRNTFQDISAPDSDVGCTHLTDCNLGFRRVGDDLSLDRLEGKHVLSDSVMVGEVVAAVDLKALGRRLGPYCASVPWVGRKSALLRICVSAK